MKIFAQVVFGFLVAIYPVLVYLGLNTFSLKQLALILLAIFVVRFVLMEFMGNKKRTPKNSEAGASDVGHDKADITSLFSLIAVVVGVALVLMVLLFEQELYLKLYPVWVNLLLLVLFSWTLKHPPSAIERIARRMDPDLSELGIRHTRQVTQAWCVFFLINGSIAAYTALFASTEQWTLYNGLIAYLLMGFMFVAEFVIRQVRKRRAGE